MVRAPLALALCLCAACPPPGPAGGPALQPVPPGTSVVPQGDGRLAAVDGAPLERLTEDPTDELFPAPTASGGLVVYQLEEFEGQGPERLAKRRVLMSLELGTRRRALLTAEDRAALQPSVFGDDQRLTFVTNAFGPLALVRAESLAPAATLQVVIGSDLAPALGEPAVSPDGSRIAFSMNDKSGARFVAVVGADGSKLTPIGEGRSPAWSPRGDKLAFVRSAGGYNHLFVLDAATLKEPAQLTTGEFDCDRPTYSPDGQRIAFSSNRGFKEGGRSRSDTLHLHVVSAGGGASTPVTRGSARAATPAWGKDGFLYFASDRDGSFDLFRVRAPRAGSGG